VVIDNQICLHITSAIEQLQTVVPEVAGITVLSFTGCKGDICHLSNRYEMHSKFAAVFQVCKVSQEAFHWLT